MTCPDALYLVVYVAQDIPSPSAMGEHLAKQLMVMVYGQQPDQQGEQQQQQQQHGQAEPIEVAASAPPSTETPRPPMGPNDEQEPPNPNSSRTAG
jgi:outer membrane biosynthesis protein TonB